MEKMEQEETKKITAIEVHTDGACRDNGKKDEDGKDLSRGGWAYKITEKNGEEVLRTVMAGGNEKGTKNNRMEMTAILAAMRMINEKSVPVKLHSDSEIVIKGLNGEYGHKKNEDLWEQLMAEKEKFSDITFEWEKGHIEDNPDNAEVDKLATDMADKLKQEK